MRKQRLILTTALLACALTGCARAGGIDEKALEIRTKYIAAEEISLSARMTADYGDRLYEYSLSYQGDGDTGTLTISEPVAISDIQVVFREDGPRLMCGGAVLDTGPLWSDGLSPAEAFPLMIEVWRTGWVSSSRRETLDGKQCIVMEMCPGDMENVTVCTWFYEENMLPAAAEIFDGDISVLRCDFSEENQTG